MDDLSQLATVILTQMRSKWIDIERMRVKHPLLSGRRNQELIRRLFVNVILICANIFEHILQEAQVFHDRYVFSHAANMTRLRTLLADRINTLYDKMNNFIQIGNIFYILIELIYIHCVNILLLK